MTFSGRYDNDVKVGLQAAVSDGTDGPAKEVKPTSSIGAPRQPADDLPSMGELFTAMDVPIFLTNDDATPYDPPHPFLHHVSLLNEVFPSAMRSVPLEASAMSSVHRVAGPRMPAQPHCPSTTIPAPFRLIPCIQLFDHEWR